MKFLVRTESIEGSAPQNPRELAAFIESLVIPSLQTVEKWEKDGKAVGGAPAAQRAGCFVIEAPSAEELSKMLTGLPLWGVSKWEVTPLVSVSSVIERAREQITQLKTLAAAIPTR
jgi:hypothetical protein